MVPLFPITPDRTAQPFLTVAIDLIVNLPMSSEHNSIITITDHDVTKATIFLPCSKTITGEEIASLYGTHVFPHYRVPMKVISDQDTRFTSCFSKELCQQLEITNNMSTAYHPQTDGQSEQSNQWLEQYLRIYTTHAQDNWVSLLPCYNTAHGLQLCLFLPHVSPFPPCVTCCPRA